MFKNFINLEKSLDLIESLENKKFAENEKIKLLKKIKQLQTTIDGLELTVNQYKEKEKDKEKEKPKGHHLNRSSAVSGDKYNPILTNHTKSLSNTRIMKNQNADLYNVKDFGYEEKPKLMKYLGDENRENNDK